MGYNNKPFVLFDYGIEYIELDLSKKEVLGENYLINLVRKSEEVNYTKTAMLLMGMGATGRLNGQLVHIFRDGCYLEVLVYLDTANLPLYTCTIEGLHVDIHIFDRGELVYLPYHTYVHSEDDNFRFRDNTIAGIYFKDSHTYKEPLLNYTSDNMKKIFNGVTFKFLSSINSFILENIKGSTVEVLEGYNTALHLNSLIQLIGLHIRANKNRILNLNKLALDSGYTSALQGYMKREEQNLKDLDSEIVIGEIEHRCYCSTLENNTEDIIGLEVLNYAIYINSLGLRTRMKIKTNLGDGTFNWLSEHQLNSVYFEAIRW